MLACTNFPLKGPETTRVNRQQRFKYFPQNFSLGTPDEKISGYAAFFKTYKIKKTAGKISLHSFLLLISQ